MIRLRVLQWASTEGRPAPMRVMLTTDAREGMTATAIRSAKYGEQLDAEIHNWWALNHPYQASPEGDLANMVRFHGSNVEPAVFGRYASRLMTVLTAVADAVEDV